jgi:hypothetical protein
MSDKWLAKGSRFDGKRQVITALRRWLDESNAQTIGDTNGYHGRFWVSADIGGHHVRIAADTTREAVRRVVDQMAAAPDQPWRVVENERGRVNKLVIGDRIEPGWFAYLTRPLPRETTI